MASREKNRRFTSFIDRVCQAAAKRHRAATPITPIHARSAPAAFLSSEPPRLNDWTGKAPKKSLPFMEFDRYSSLPEGHPRISDSKGKLLRDSIPPRSYVFA